MNDGQPPRPPQRAAANEPNRDADLLATLLLAPCPPARPTRRWGRSSSTALRVMLVLLIIALLIPAGQTALTLLAIRRNLRALVVSPSAVSLPTTAVIPITPVQVTALNPALLHPTATPTRAPTPAPTPAYGDAVTVLLLGSDLRLDESGPARADAIMLARIDPQRQRVALLSLTRDMMAEIPGYGYARINAAYNDGGPELARATISGMLQIPIDYYATINFAGFIAAVDVLGGVTVNVDKELYQPGWELHVMPGPQHMDGLTALRYSRIREPDSDYDRIKRQQSVAVAIMQRIREQGALESLQQIATLSAALHGYIETDMPEDRMIGLAWALRNLPLDAIEHHSVEGYMVSTGVIPGDPYAQVPDPQWLETLRRALLGLDAP